MDTFAVLAVDDRRTYFTETAALIGLNPEHVEKDFWVCWTLNQLFALPEIGDQLTFKGGTSLSKAYRIIQRFSEDIDITISREYLGFGGAHDPENAPSGKKRKAWLQDLKKACGMFVSTKLAAALSASISQRLAGAALTSDAQDPDQQTLLFRYPGCWPDLADGYFGRFVKIELGARSDPWPTEQLTVSPYVAEHFPNRFTIGRRPVQVLAKERTFWEKAALLHEENCRPSDKPIKPRLSRHYYDLARMIELGVDDSALDKIDLFDRVVEHRSVFFAHSWVDYETMKRGSFHIVPREGRESEWKKDYERTKEMFFSSPPAFEDVLKLVATFEHRLNST